MNWRRLFGLKPKRKRLELRCVTYLEAEKLFQESPGAWTIAKEEDNNQSYGWVFLERLSNDSFGPEKVEEQPAHPLSQ
jgi:hypothetical protein